MDEEDWLEYNSGLALQYFDIHWLLEAGQGRAECLILDGGQDTSLD